MKMRNNESAPSGESDKDMATEVPKSYAARFSELVEIADGFCDAHCNAEYVRHAPREAQVMAYQKGLIPWIPADRPKPPQHRTERGRGQR